MSWQYENFHEYAVFNSLVRTCDFCGQDFVPNAPNQKRHSTNQGENSTGSEDDEAIICAAEQWKASLSKNSFIRLVLGMTVQEFIEQYGETGDW